MQSHFAAYKILPFAVCQQLPVTFYSFFESPAYWFLPVARFTTFYILARLEDYAFCAGYDTLQFAPFRDFYRSGRLADFTVHRLEDNTV